MDIMYLLLTLWRRKIILIAVPVFSTLLAYFLTQNMVEMYASSSRLSTGFTTGEGIRVNDDFNIREANLKFSNLLSTMESGVLINMLSYQLILHDLDSSKAPFRDIDHFSAETVTQDELRLAKPLFEQHLRDMEPLTVGGENSDLMLKVLRGFGYTYPWLTSSMNIRRIPNTDYIEISFVCPNRDLSSYAVNTYFNEFIRYYSAQKLESSGESVDFFEELVSQKKAELDQKTLALQNFKTNNSFVEMDGQAGTDQILTIEGRITDVNSKIYGLQLKLDYLNDNYSDATKGGTASKFDNEKVLNLRSKINSLNTRYINSGSTDKVLADSLAYLRQQLNFELSFAEDTDQGTASDDYISDLANQIKNTEIEMEIERSTLNQLNTQLRNLRGGQSTYASTEAALTALETEVDVASKEYIDVVNRFNDAKNRLLASTSSIKQVNLAVPAANPIPSKRIFIIAGSGLLSFGLVLFVIIGLVIIDGSIKTASRFENLLEMPVIGTLVKVNVNKIQFDSIFLNPSKDKREEIFKHSLRKVRHELESSGGKSVLVTSTKKGEGKSFLIFSLAYVLSLVKKRVLIIDTNFKNNDLTKLLKNQADEEKLLEAGSKNRGVELISLEPHDSGSYLKSIIQPTRFDNIYFIGNNEGQNSPEEVLPTDIFSDILDVLSTKFDYILFEGPSLNEFADTHELEQYADKILAVFAADSSIKQLDRESIEFLEGHKDKYIGAILNKVDVRDINV